MDASGEQRIDVRFVLSGQDFALSADVVTERLRHRRPEEIRTHWVEVEGVRFPVKQALEAALGINRTEFTSHAALLQFRRLGLVTSQRTRPAGVPARRPAARKAAQVSVDEAGAAFATLVAFLRQAPLTEGVGALEHALVGVDAHRAEAIGNAAGLTSDLLEAALIVRTNVGRVSDVIHATVIALALPVILEDGETVTERPSLGPGNDPSRLFDLATNRRVAEFKVAVWSGGDVVRKRALVADLVHLAMDGSGRRPELWAVGTEPARFLRTSTSPVGELLGRSSPHLQHRFTHRYGTSAIPLREFTATHARHVELLDITDVVPAVAAALR
ncbi:hypothetical protein [Amycolatopsis magusensis]|uniref:hypothetical protein n=1 Tax=Amycolatopsis magusensis TaxID=882444 RepID=UPI0037BC4C28